MKLLVSNEVGDERVYVVKTPEKLGVKVFERNKGVALAVIDVNSMVTISLE